MPRTSQYTPPVPYESIIGTDVLVGVHAGTTKDFELGAVARYGYPGRVDLIPDGALTDLVLDDCSNAALWEDSVGASNPTVDSTRFTVGSSSITQSLATTASTGYIRRTLAAPQTTAGRNRLLFDVMWEQHGQRTFGEVSRITVADGVNLTGAKRYGRIPAGLCSTQYHVNVALFWFRAVVPLIDDTGLLANIRSFGITTDAGVLDIGASYSHKMWIGYVALASTSPLDVANYGTTNGYVPADYTTTVAQAKSTPPVLSSVNVFPGREHIGRLNGVRSAREWAELDETGFVRECSVDLNEAIETSLREHGELAFPPGAMYWVDGPITVLGVAAMQKVVDFHGATLFTRVWRGVDNESGGSGNGDDSILIFSNCADVEVRNLNIFGYRDVHTDGAKLVVDTYKFSATANTSANTITAIGMGVQNGDVVRLTSSGGSLPAPFIAGVQYYVVGTPVATSTFQLALTLGGTAIGITTAGSGVLVQRGGEAKVFPVSINSSSNVLTATGMSFANGEQVRFSLDARIAEGSAALGGVMPTGLDTTTAFFVVGVTGRSTSFKVSLASGGGEVDIGAGAVGVLVRAASETTAAPGITLSGVNDCVRCTDRGGHTGSFYGRLPYPAFDATTRAELDIHYPNFKFGNVFMFWLHDEEQVAGDWVIEAYDAQDGFTVLGSRVITCGATSSPHVLAIETEYQDIHGVFLPRVRKALGPNTNSLTVDKLVEINPVANVVVRHDTAHGIALQRCQRMTFDNVHVEGVACDAITTIDAAAIDITIRNSLFRACNRQGASFNNGVRLKLHNTIVSESGRSNVDVEPYGLGNKMIDIELIDVELHNAVNYCLSMAGWGAIFESRLQNVKMRGYGAGPITGGSRGGEWVGVSAKQNGVFTQQVGFNYSGIGLIGRAIAHDGGGIHEEVSPMEVASDVGVLPANTLLYPVTAVDFAVNDTITATGVSTINGERINITSLGGTVPGGLTAGTFYYVVSTPTASDTFKLSDTPGGAAKNLTSAGTGTVYATKSKIFVDNPNFIPVVDMTQLSIQPYIGAPQGSNPPGGLSTGRAWVLRTPVASNVFMVSGQANPGYVLSASSLDITTMTGEPYISPVSLGDSYILQSHVQVLPAANGFIAIEVVAAGIVVGIAYMSYLTYSGQSTRILSGLTLLTGVAGGVTTGLISLFGAATPSRLIKDAQAFTAQGGTLLSVANLQTVVSSGNDVEGAEMIWRDVAGAYTLTDLDVNQGINATTTATITIPNTLTKPGSVIIKKGGGGDVTVVAGVGVTLDKPGNRSKITTQYQTCAIIPITLTHFALSGAEAV